MIDLNKLEEKFRQFFDKETEESFNEWLAEKSKRKPNLKIAFTDCWDFDKKIPESDRWMAQIDDLKILVVESTKQKAFEEIIKTIRVITMFQSDYRPTHSVTQNQPDVVEEFMPIHSSDRGKIIGDKIPMSLLNDEQAYVNHSQSLKKLAGRGGLSLSEIVAIFQHQKWKPLDDDFAIGLINEKLAAAKVPDDSPMLTKLKEYIKTVPPEKLIKDWEDVGYKFIPVDAPDNDVLFSLVDGGILCKPMSDRKEDWQQYFLNYINATKDQLDMFNAIWEAAKSDKETMSAVWRRSLLKGSQSDAVEQDKLWKEVLNTFIPNAIGEYSDCFNRLKQKYSITEKL